MSDVELRLREALRVTVPDDLESGDLLEGARRYRTRARRARVAGAAAVAAVALVAAGAVVSSLDRPARTVPARPTVITGECGAGTPMSTGVAVLPETASAAWLCLDGDGAGGGGWVLPTEHLTRPYTQFVALPAGSAACSSGGSEGPPFTLVLQGPDGTTSTFHSRDDECGGTATVVTFLTALADQEADRAAEGIPLESRPCHSADWWLRQPNEPSSSGPLVFDRGTRIPFVAATLCLSPSYLEGDPVRTIPPLAPRHYVSAPLPAAVIGSLNADLTSARNGYAGNGACLGEGPWRYLVVGRTQAGQYRVLETGCLDEAFVVGGPDFGFDLSAGTTEQLRTIVRSVG